MANPDMPNIPGMGSMTDTLDFVKKLWGGMGLPGMQGAPGVGQMPGMNIGGMQIPGMVMPTLSVEEINKKITDLKTVESWLALNMNMLRGTIQALEVQAATLSALNAMGQSVSATMKAAGIDPAAARAAQSAHSAPSANSDGARSAGDGAAAGANGGASTQPSNRDQQDAAALAAPLVNAAAWWNMLQDQFQQAVSNAMANEPPADAAKAATVADAEKAKAKPKAATPPSRKTKPKE